MKQPVELIVVIPVGPSCQPDYIEDTINSIGFYVRASHKIILADDSQKGTGQQLKKIFPGLDLCITPSSMGKLCGLYVTLSQAFCHALDNYEFKAVLRIDTDALLIGKQPEQDAFKLFDANPLIGMAGQYPFDYEGRLWDRSWPGGQLYRMMHTAYFFRRPLVHTILVRQYLKAKKNNYQRGESVFGGACFFSAACLKKLREKGFLPMHDFKRLKLEEDHLFGLLIKSVGFELSSLSGTGQPFACAWLGLAASPQSLVDSGKKVIHSTRFWKDMKEKDIRAWFKEKRVVTVKDKYTLSINN